MVVVSSNFSVPAEGVLFQAPTTKLLVNDQEVGTATLYVTENNVIWGGGVGPQGALPTISLLYPTISLHAIQREPIPAIYMVLNYELGMFPEVQAAAGDADDIQDDEYDPDEHPITQLRFVPSSEADLPPLYQALSQGQALHPDPADDVDDDDYLDGEENDDGSDEFEDAEESAAPEDAAARLRHMRLDNGAHYEDAEDTELNGE